MTDVITIRRRHSHMWYSTPGYAVDIALDSVQLIIEVDDKTIASASH